MNAMNGKIWRKISTSSFHRQIKKSGVLNANMKQDLVSLFDDFDMDGSGQITLEELTKATASLGLEFSEKQLQKIITEVDTDNNGKIDFDEFCCVIKRLANKPTKNQKSWDECVKQCFEVFDRTNTGILKEDDFHYVLKVLGNIEDEQIRESIFNEVDIDGTGYVDMEEFANWIRLYMTEDDFKP